MQRTLSILVLLAIGLQGMAQTATGSWFGKADVDMSGMHNNYLTELVIKQKGNRVEGIFGYYFRDKYQSFFVHGRYNVQTREVVIENIPIIYFKSNSTVNSIEINTTFRGKLIASRAKSSLVGRFYMDEKYKYTCPDLSVSYTLDVQDKKQDSLIKVAKAGEHIWKPQADDVVVEATPAVQQPVASTIVPAVASTTPDSQMKDAALSTSVVSRATMDSTQVPSVNVSAPPDLTKADIARITESFSKRKPVLNRVLEVDSDSLRISFYDNGEIDGDSISVFVNNQMVLTHQELAAKALTVYLKLDSTRELNELSMFAENLGKYPPNTALMVVTDGINRYEIFMSSSLTENATVQLKRRKTL